MIRQINKRNLGITEPMRGYYHGDGIWFEKSRHDTYRKLAEAIVREFKPRAVLELGSGAGSLAWHIRDLSCAEVVTVDGNPDTIKSPWIKSGSHFIGRTDQELIFAEANVLMQFDTILSFEHFEHILPERFDVLMANILRHADPGATLVATAANCTYADLPEVHCNVMPAERWHSYLSCYGLTKLDASVCPGNEPFNFQMNKTTELVYRIP